MTVLEIMERAGLKETNLSVAWVKDAIHLIQSSSKQKIKSRKQDIIKSVGSDDNVYIMPPDMIALESISIKDTSDGKYKKIKRIINQPSYLTEDTSP
jgi:Fic family protein